MELRRGDYVGDFEAAVFAARIGDVVGSARTEHGWLVARVDEIAAESTMPYAVARSAIADELLEVARARAFDEWLESRRHELSRVAPDYEHPGHPRHGQMRHRH
jgi:parvulin-like peptidyl-prolyl isomerase